MFGFAVAPFVGAWIEIKNPQCFGGNHTVAPFAGAWIEISRAAPLPPAWRVAPFAGAWIEISKLSLDVSDYDSRSLRGSVD